MKQTKEKLLLCILGLGILLGLGALTAQTDLLCRSVSDKVFRLHIWRNLTIPTTRKPS